MRNAFKIVVRKYKKNGKELVNLGLCSITLYFEELLCEGVTWILLTRDTALSRVLLCRK
jgi:hypothetical protein